MLMIFRMKVRVWMRSPQTSQCFEHDLTMNENLKTPIVFVLSFQIFLMCNYTL